MTHRATGIGSMPGTEFRETTDVVLGELGELPFIPELPARGPHAAMIGRTAAMITSLGIDLQPAGWRLTDAPGIDHRRAASLLAEDLDTFEELSQDRVGPVKVQLAGPWTLASSMERPRGDRVLADHGARRDLAQALAEGLAGHLADVRRRLSPTELVVQVDEPALPAVLAGAVPTASGFGRHRSVSDADAATALDWVLDVVVAADALPVVHCCAADLPVALLQRTLAAALSLDLMQVGVETYDALAGWLDAGRSVWVGVVPSVDPAGPPPTESDLTRRVLRWWTDVGYPDAEQLPDTVVTPTCGLAGASPPWARSALDLARAIARNLSVEGGKIAP